MPFPRIPNLIFSFSLPAPNNKGQLFGQSVLALVLSFVFFAAFHPSLSSQDNLFDARLLTTEDGLANLMTTAVYKDKRGFLWAGTAYGLNRYDGYNFKLFTREENGLHANTNIVRIREDDEGRIWVFYQGGLNIIPEPYTVRAIDIFDPKTERAVPFDAFFSGTVPFKATDIYLPEVLDPKNRLWVHTNKGELFLYENGRFKKIFQQEGAFFQYIAIDNEENIWLGWEKNLWFIDRSGTVLEKVELPGYVRGAWAGPDQAVWLAVVYGPEDQGVSLWRKPKNSPLAPWGLTRNGKPIEVQAQYPFLHRNSKGYWYVNLENQIHLFDAQGEWLYNFQTLLGKKSHDSVLDLFEDGDRIWLASSTGVLKLSARANPFQLIHRKEGMFSDCRSITEDEKGNIYFLNSKVFHWDVPTQECRELPNSRGAAYALLYTDSLIWAGTYGVRPIGFQLDIRTKERTNYRPFTLDNHLLVYAVAKTSRPGMYLAGLNRGVAYLDLNMKKLLPYDGYDPGNQKDSLLERSEVNFIHQNALGFWLATNNGIFLLKEKEGVIGYYGQSTGDLPFNHVRHIYEDEEGVFWLATRGGGVIQWQPPFSEKKKPVLKRPYRQFTTEDGLADNFTYAVYEDDYGKLWIPSDKGLMRMDKASFRVRTFTTDDGLPHNEFNHTAHYQAKDGTLYFGGLGGLIAFHPNVFAQEGTNSTPMAFTGYYVLEEGADKMADKTQLLQEADAITIRPSDKFFELHFTLLDFDDSGKHRYAYQIEGYSSNWNYIDDNFIRITNLPYGDYTLRVQGQNSSHGWSERQLSLAICVVKPFYLQWWFMITLAVLVAAAILTLLQWRTRQLKKGKERLEAEVQKRTRQLEEQNQRIEADRQTIAGQAEELKALDKAKTRFFSNITHEFRTPLTLIIGPLEQVIAEQPPPTIFRRRLNGVLKNARHLLGLINQLLDLSKLESGRMKIEAARGDLVAYTQELIKRFEPLAEKKELHLSFVAHQDCWETQFDKEKWDKIVYNLLSNAIKFTPPGNAVQVSLASAQKNGREYIRLDVKDTGVGIGEEQIKQVFDRFYQAQAPSQPTPRGLGGAGGTGIGLALVKELVELQGGQARVASEPGKGTSFELLLPVLSDDQAQPLEGHPEIADLPVAAPPAETAASASKPRAEDSREKLELLIIEDNEEVREYIRYCIDTSKYNIIEAADGEEGVQKARALVPDLIISDVMMPKKDGFEVAKAIRSYIGTSHIPLILLTAKASLASRLEGLQRGADAYLTKPFSPQELALRIDKLIEIRRLLQQRYQGGLQPGGDDAYQQEDEFITNLREYILEHIDESNLNGDSIGRHFGMSRTHLHRKLKALTGQPITEFVRSIRLQKALELIREGELNVSEVSYQTGFSSLSHFSRSFKKAYGKSPSEV